MMAISQAAYPQEPMAEFPETVQSEAVIVTMAASFLAALHALLRLNIWPERIKLDAPTQIGRLEFLLKEALDEIQGYPSQGFSEADEVEGKQTAIVLIEHIASTIRKEIDSPEMHS
jgi:hypothetical protein